MLQATVGRYHTPGYGRPEACGQAKKPDFAGSRRPETVRLSVLY